jgi:hypothetical protein
MRIHTIAGKVEIQNKTVATLSLSSAFFKLVLYKRPKTKKGLKKEFKTGCIKWE